MKSKEINKSHTPFTIEDVSTCWPKWHEAYFVEVLNGEYPLEEAREDLRGLIESKRILTEDIIKI